MKTKGIIIINRDFSREWLDLLLKSGFNTVGLHSLYQYGGVEGHLNWWVQEETQNLIAEFEKNGKKRWRQLKMFNSKNGIQIAQES